MAEIAGLVLGAVPLLISALEHYRDIIDPVIRFRNWRGDLKNSIRRLAVERATYHDNLRVLLSKAVRFTKMEEMISDPQCELWTDENLTGDLRDEWNSSYEPCIDLVRDIGENLETIAASLNIEGSDQVRCLHPGHCRAMLTSCLEDYTRRPESFRVSQLSNINDARRRFPVRVSTANKIHNEAKSTE